MHHSPRFTIRNAEDTPYGQVIATRFKWEALGVGISDSESAHPSPVQQPAIVNRQLKLPRNSTNNVRQRRDTLKPQELRDMLLPPVLVVRRRAYSDPGRLASLDESILWACERETNTDFLKAMHFSLQNDDLRSSGAMSSRGEKKDLLWTEDESVAYVLEAEKDGSVAFSIRKGMLDSILRQIVLWLIRPPGSSKTSLKAVESQLEYFLCAHERVISTADLLVKLHDISTIDGNSQEGVFKFIHFWLQTSYYPDFVSFTGEVNTETMAALHNFITTTFSASSGDASKNQRQELLMMIRDTGPWLKKTILSPRRKEKRNSRRLIANHFLDLTILDLSDEEVAIALTRLDAEMMRSMKRADLTSPNFEQLKNINAMSEYVLYAERLKKFVFWIATQIISAPSKSRIRVRIYRKWVIIAKNCVLLNNFSSTCAILAGLSHQAVARMTHLLREVPADVLNLKKEMEEQFMGFSDNHVRGLINHCIESGIPCIPTIDVLRKDMLRIDEGSKGDEEGGLLKFFKVVSFGKAINFIEQAYSQPFPFETQRSELSERELKIYNFVQQMPNTVKSTPILMKMSFDVQSPSARELKMSLYKSLLKK